MICRDVSTKLDGSLRAEMFAGIDFPSAHRRDPRPEPETERLPWLYRPGLLKWYKTASVILVPLLWLIGILGLASNDALLLELFSPLADGVFLFGTVDQARNFLTVNNLLPWQHVVSFVLHSIPCFFFFVQPRSYGGIFLAAGVLLAVFVLYFALHRVGVDAWPYSLAPLEAAALVCTYCLIQLV